MSKIVRNVRGFSRWVWMVGMSVLVNVVKFVRNVTGIVEKRNYVCV